jgi:N-carbamoyl-L-amino-acid hydrolase
MTMNDDNPKFLADFSAVSRIGATPGGGVERQAGTAADHSTKAWLAGWFAEHGFETRSDGIGNQFGLLELVPGAPYVLLGSHLDSQPLAGKFDGAYGVLAASFAAARVANLVRTGTVTATRNLAVVNWFNEEGSRFKPSMMGSSVFTGKLNLDTALEVRDSQGVTVRSALEAGDAIGDYQGPDVACYGEIHIEQGRVLERENVTIGTVYATWAASKYEITVLGDQSHTGSTAMSDRKDALFGAALVIVAAREIADGFTPDELHSSVSEAMVLPNSPVVVAREVRMNLDLRSADEAVLKEANAQLEKRLAAIETRANVEITRTMTHSWGVLPYQDAGVELAKSVADELGLSNRRIMTIAGHDSTNMKDKVPTIMLFVPSVEGISHNERECTNDENCCAGVTLLTAIAGRLVQGDLPSA